MYPVSNKLSTRGRLHLLCWDVKTAIGLTAEPHPFLGKFEAFYGIDHVQLISTSSFHLIARVGYMLNQNHALLGENGEKTQKKSTLAIEGLAWASRCPKLGFVRCP